MNMLTRLTLAGACALLLSQPILAQVRDAGSKIRGEAIAGHEVQTYQRHAQDRAQILYYHAQPQQPIPKQEAKELVAGIRNDLTVSDKALAKIKAEHAKEPEVVKQIELIEKHHAKARANCDMADQECLKDKCDNAVVGNCCSEMWHEMNAAQVETQKLLKMLKIDKLEPPKKVDAKKDATKKEATKK